MVWKGTLGSIPIIGTQLERKGVAKTLKLVVLGTPFTVNGRNTLTGHKDDGLKVVPSVVSSIPDLADVELTTVSTPHASFYIHAIQKTYIINKKHPKNITIYTLSSLHEVPDPITLLGLISVDDIRLGGGTARMSTPEVCVAPRFLIVSCDIIGALVRLHISTTLLTDTLNRLVGCTMVQVGTVVGGNGRLAKVMEVPTSPFVTTVFILMGIPAYS